MVNPARTPEQLASERILGIDVLRGLAVIAVVFNHLPHYAHGGFRENPWFFPALMMDYGYLGVPLFVLISGFCIHRRAAIKQMTTGEASLNWIEFWKKRFWRLYPPYLAAIVFSLGCACLLHERSNDVFDSLVPDLLTHLFLVHNLTALYPGGLGNGAFWSLGMEEQLYLLYFFLFLLIRKRSAIFAAGVAVFTTISWRILITSAPLASIDSIGGLGMWGMWPFSYWMHWALGALAVDAYFGNCRLPKWCSSPRVAILAVTVGLLTNRITFEFISKTSLKSLSVVQAWSGQVSLASSLGDLLITIGFFCMLNWFVQNPDHPAFRNGFNRSIGSIGKISYAIYLTHFPVLFSLEYYLPFSNSAADWIQRLIVYTCICLLAGVAFFFGIEQWFLAGRCPFVWRRPATSHELAGASISSGRVKD